ncbi:2-hydroxy-3-oxopropionate reductase [Labrys miyagiensis]|uniref:2-hydroxy-3-oxopropionate reductase n=1 Tax=Labrys miyagiensis TaxID=346912 RepID=A0ABQ6CCI0_9HYPH|nr:NAD(P)-dependent oxidoreductase [Labrys miyagiensis]GLS18078.1 2-hydroxy-3-oxopropionate reductase [Labrys miyagiensis]
MSVHDRPAVSIVGAGIMGSAIATRLLASGHHVTVFDLEPVKVAAVVAKGGKAAQSAAEAARASSFVITSLNSAAIVHAAVFGVGGIAEGADAEGLLIDMSSIDPVSTRLFAGDLASSTGMRWVDAPLSGGAPGALAGRLTVMAGGAPEDVQRARSVMDSLCANYTHMGPSGAGQTTKLVNQILCAIGFQAVAEAVRLAEAGGVDATRLAEALKGGRADSSILQEFGPKMARRDYSPTGRIDNMMKDLEAVQAFSSGARLPLPLTGLITELHRSLLAAGLGPADTAAIMLQFSGFREQ